MRRIVTISCAIASILFGAAQAHAQAGLQNTRTVDLKQGAADFTSIQLAINDLGSPGVRSTVLIFSGVYDENIVLDDADENIDLVGVDPDGVIIAPSSGNGIEIKSGTEVSRNNLIKNLTIRTDNGHGILIQKANAGDEPPADIIIEDVTIDVQVSGALPTPKEGILAEDVNGLTIRDVRITTELGHGIHLKNVNDTPQNVEITGVTIDANGPDKNCLNGVDAQDVTLSNCILESAADDGAEAGTNFSFDTCTIRATDDTKTALSMVGESGLEISNSLIGVEVPGTAEADRSKRGILIDGGSDVEISNSIIRGVEEGVRLDQPGDDVVFRACIIQAEGAPTGAGSQVAAVFGEANDANTDTPPVFQSCRLEAIGGTDASTTEAVKAAEIDQTDGVRFADCAFRAVSRNDGVDEVFGIECRKQEVFITGGIIETIVEPDTTAAEKVTDVFDLVSNDAGLSPVPEADHIFIAGTRFSKWLGAINAEERERSVQQRLLSVDDESTTAVHAGIDLTSQEQEVTTGITDPDVYRVLSVAGNQAGMSQDVYIVGTNWAGDAISEKYTLNGTSTVEGDKPFRTVTKIIAPAESQSNQTVTVGTTNRLGLYYPISVSGNVIEWSKLNASDVYEVQSLGNLTITNDGLRFGTVEPDSITSGDDFQFDVLTVQ